MTVLSDSREGSVGMSGSCRGLPGMAHVRVSVREAKFATRQMEYTLYFGHTARQQQHSYVRQFWVVEAEGSHERGESQSLRGSVSWSTGADERAADSHGCLVSQLSAFGGCWRLFSSLSLLTRPSYRQSGEMNGNTLLLQSSCL